jgi:predicted RNA-binding Zn-ribbon protein involved in translation (DUF1610 family)
MSGIIDDDLPVAVNQDGEQLIDEEEEIEFFECQKCGEYNIIKLTPKRRRSTLVKHVKVDDITWASLRRYASINHVTINYALMLLLHAAKTSNVSYLINEKNLVKNRRKKKQQTNALAELSEESQHHQ